LCPRKYSDRDVQYASIAYRQRLAERDITISMSRPGNPFDNAKAESFMKTLKAEEVNGKAFVDLNDARHRIDSFIADVYNRERLHSALGYRHYGDSALNSDRAGDVVGKIKGERAIELSAVSP
jgi:transposase InsO family protein